MLSDRDLGPVLTLTAYDVRQCSMLEKVNTCSYFNFSRESDDVRKVFRFFDEKATLSSLEFLYNLDRVKQVCCKEKFHYSLNSKLYLDIIKLKDDFIEGVQEKFSKYDLFNSHIETSYNRLYLLSNIRVKQFRDSRDFVNTLFDKLIPTFPKEIQSNLNRLSSKSEFICDSIVSWLSYNKVSLVNGDLGDNFSIKEMFKFFKNAIKYEVHKRFSWQQVGYGGYMTGDWLAAVGAVNANAKLSLKYLDYSIHDNESQVSFSENMRKDRLVFSHNPFFDQMNQVNISFTHLMDSKGGKTFSNLKQRYKERFGRRKIRPWNQHITYIHSEIKKQHMSVVKKLESLLSLISSKEKLFLDNYFNHVLDVNNNPLIIWGRRSGHNFGAHKELDSDDDVFLDLITHLGEKFPHRDIFFFGDRINGLNSIKNSNFKPFVSFWKKDLLQSRISQLYLLKKFQDRNAIQLGMRSGNLEGHAYLGLKTIYFDERDSRKVESSQRLEQLVGTAATDRHLHLDDIEIFEKEHQGVFPHYKRFVTKSSYGLTQDRLHQFKLSTNQLVRFLKEIKNYDLNYVINQKILNKFLTTFSVDTFMNFTLKEKVDSLLSFSQLISTLKVDKEMSSLRLSKKKYFEIRKAYQLCKPEPLYFDLSRIYFRIFKRMYLKSKKYDKKRIEGLKVGFQKSLELLPPKKMALALKNVENMLMELKESRHDVLQSHFFSKDEYKELFALICYLDKM